MISSLSLFEAALLGTALHGLILFGAYYFLIRRRASEDDCRESRPYGPNDSWERENL